MNCEVSENCLRLLELFPDISLKHITHILKLANDDFDSSVEQLLNYEIIKDELNKLDENSNLYDNNSNVKKQEWVLIDKKIEDQSVNIKNNKIKSKNKKAKSNLNIEKSFSQTYSSSSMTTPATNITSNSTKNSINSLNSAMESLKIEELSKKFEVEDEIMLILEIDESNSELVDWYFTENSYNKLNTIYDIMLNFNPEKTIEDQSRNKIDTVSFELICSDKVEGSENSVKMSDLIRGGANYKNKNSLNSNGWNELQLLIDDNPELNLPKQFYMLAMKWFHGDLGHILHAAILLNECFEKKIKTNKVNNFIKGRKNLIIDDLTNDIEINKFVEESNKNQLSTNRYNNISYNKYENPFAGENLNKIDNLESRITRLKNARDSSNDKILKSYYSHSISKTKSDIKNHYESMQDNQVIDKIAKAKLTFELDCHNISVKNAIYAINVCLNYWWDEEIYQRNIMNTKFEFTRVCHVKPFTIITGRGLHSAGQIPKIKNASLKYLKQHNYKFEENGPLVKVLGKKR